jgi:putative phosphoesterase
MSSQKHLIGVISDTHNLLDARVPVLFTGVDRILHAGDIGNPSVYHGLRHIAPVTAVLGNTDASNVLPEIQEQQVFELYGARFWLTHILGDPRKLTTAMRRQLTQIQPQVVVFGHSHQPFLERRGAVLFFNPGSAGPRRFALPRTVGFLEIEDGQIRGRIVAL